MRRALILVAALGLAGIGGGLALTAPERVDPARLEGLTGDAARGEAVFRISGCASCHAAPGAEGEARLVLAGGLAFETDFGTFRAPNVSPSPEGIDGWSVADLANAMLAGVSPDGAHYYPAFPYGSYAKMEPQEIADLHAYMMTLPPSNAESPPHELGFPFSIRRGIGLWKLLYLSPEPVIAVEGETLSRGRYLVEGPGHCGECHTARNALGGPDLSRWLAGGPNPDGKGRIPNLTPHETGLTWSAADIAEYLRSGFTPDYDVAGGSMADVVKNTAALSGEDRAAIAAYLKALPPHPTER
ncbi:MAG: c-type cytochrome [Pikeienuella sp.]|uniref:c-type cytochrome n=1 Tax=Pikeienuella sp. TaxID=2831957 RepID=UPI00391C0F40